MKFIVSLIGTIIGLILIALLTVLLLAPNTVSEFLQQLEAVQLPLRLALVVVIYLVALMIFSVRVRMTPRGKSDALTVRTSDTISSVTVESVRERVLKTVGEVPGVATVAAQVKSVGGRADLDLNVTTTDDQINIPEKQREISRVLDQVIKKQLGLQMLGRPRINIQLGSPKLPDKPAAPQTPPPSPAPVVAPIPVPVSQPEPQSHSPSTPPSYAAAPLIEAPAPVPVYSPPPPPVIQAPISAPPPVTVPEPEPEPEPQPRGLFGLFGFGNAQADDAPNDKPDEPEVRPTSSAPAPLVVDVPVTDELVDDADDAFYTMLESDREKISGLRSGSDAYAYEEPSFVSHDDFISHDTPSDSGTDSSTNTDSDPRSND